ncbi:MAG: hypothetical protein E7525_01950 [Ruminococcaceae bacterium]|nr:hypothetical protein [Oscillospiraceae bacterium]
MIIFKKNASDKANIKNTIALKRNVYAIILSVVFIVGAVLLTALSTVLSQRFPLDIDLTADKIYTMTEENVDFIKGVDRKVNIYVCLTEEEYSCVSESSYNLGYYAATKSFVDLNSDNVSYYLQTVDLLEKYSQYNKNINVTYLDVAQPSAKEITAGYEDYNWAEGDILVESTFAVNGEEITRRTVVTFEETYTLMAGIEETESLQEAYLAGYYDCIALYGYGYGYMIAQNNIEQKLSSAIYTVTSEFTPTFLVPTSYSKSEILKEVLEATLTANNYKIEYVDGLLSTILSKDNHDKYTGIIMADCTTDISIEDYALLNEFLDNGGKKGKALVFFAGTQTYKLTNLCAFLGEWGIGFQSGILYETSGNMHMPNDNTTMLLSSLKTDYTPIADSKSSSYLASNLVPMTQLYTNDTGASHVRTSEVLLRTGSNGTVTVMPIDQSVGTWKPTPEAKLDAYATAIITEDAVSLNGEFVLSHVVAFASSSFIDSDWQQYANVKNVNFALDVFNASVGLSDVPFKFVAKTITAQRYAENATGVTIIKYTFMLVVPVALVGCGIAVWIRRRTK